MVHGGQGYASIDDIPDQDIKVVDCFVNSQHVGAVVDDAIWNKDRLQIDAVWLESVWSTRRRPRAPERLVALAHGICPRIQWPKVAREGMQR